MTEYSRVIVLSATVAVKFPRTGVSITRIIVRNKIVLLSSKNSLLKMILTVETIICQIHYS